MSMYVTIPSCNSNIYGVTVCYCNCSDNYYSSSTEYLFISGLWGDIVIFTLIKVVVVVSDWVIIFLFCQEVFLCGFIIPI